MSLAKCTLSLDPVTLSRRKRSNPSSYRPLFRGPCDARLIGGWGQPLVRLCQLVGAFAHTWSVSMVTSGSSGSILRSTPIRSAIGGPEWCTCISGINISRHPDNSKSPGTFSETQGRPRSLRNPIARNDRALCASPHACYICLLTTHLLNLGKSTMVFHNVSKHLTPSLALSHF